MEKTDFYISQFNDGSLVLNCGKDGMETDLVFASGAMNGDPLLEKQKKILEYILRAIQQYDPDYKQT